MSREHAHAVTRTIDLFFIMDFRYIIYYFAWIFLCAQSVRIPSIDIPGSPTSSVNQGVGTGTGDQGGDQSAICAICHDAIENEGSLNRETDAWSPVGDETMVNPITRLSCSHLYHSSCLSRWIRTGHGRISDCPICRDPIEPSTLISVLQSNSVSPAYTSPRAHFSSHNISPRLENLSLRNRRTSWDSNTSGTISGSMNTDDEWHRIWDDLQNDLLRILIQATDAISSTTVIQDTQPRVTRRQDPSTQVINGINERGDMTQVADQCRRIKNIYLSYTLDDPNAPLTASEQLLGLRAGVPVREVEQSPDTAHRFRYRKFLSILHKDVIDGIRHNKDQFMRLARATGMEDRTPRVTMMLERLRCDWNAMIPTFIDAPEPWVMNRLGDLERQCRKPDSTEEELRLLLTENVGDFLDKMDPSRGYETGQSVKSALDAMKDILSTVFDSDSETDSNTDTDDDGDDDD